MKKIIFCLLVILSAEEVSAQAQLNRYIISFRDKNTTPFSLNSPAAFLSPAAIARRTRYNLSFDSTDLPVTPRYIDSIRLAGNVTILNASKWLNSVTIFTTDATALNKINNFPFVRSAKPIAAKQMSTPVRRGIQVEENIERKIYQQEGVFSITNNFFNYGSSATQILMHNGNFLHNIGLRGQNMVIGMLDAGYLNYLTLRSFDSARLNGQILGTWDFVAREASVNEDNAHGMQCLSIIVANVPGQFVGSAPKASFYLYRSEDVATEYPIEEHNWVCAAERLDSVGGDMISSSLGYYDFDNPVFNYPFSAMDGNTTISAIGADLAAKKGILVVNAAGNEGNNSWGRIISPADGDSVLAVGAVNAQRVPASFTSRGPSADGQVKPDVASMGVGTTVQYPNNSFGGSNGTSFAAPNITGLAACLWQGFKELNNMKIIDALRRSGSRANNPNDTVGYGIPDVKKALIDLTMQVANTSASINNCQATINWTSKDMSAMRYEIERKLPGQSSFEKISERNGTGNIFQTNNYQFTDNIFNAGPGTASYRIRQFFDTSATGFAAAYIDTVNLTLATTCTAAENGVVLMPNPAGSLVGVRVTTSESIEDLMIEFVNAKGQRVAAYKRNKTAGTALFEFPVSHLAAGIYFISVYDGSKKIAVEKMVKL
jgi:serine protease AprX